VTEPLLSFLHLYIFSALSFILQFTLLAISIEISTSQPLALLLNSQLGFASLLIPPRRTVCKAYLSSSFGMMSLTSARSCLHISSYVFELIAHRSNLKSYLTLHHVAAVVAMITIFLSKDILLWAPLLKPFWFPGLIIGDFLGEISLLRHRRRPSIIEPFGPWIVGLQVVVRGAQWLYLIRLLNATGVPGMPLIWYSCAFIFCATEAFEIWHMYSAYVRDCLVARPVSSGARAATRASFIHRSLRAIAKATRVWK